MSKNSFNVATLFLQLIGFPIGIEENINFSFILSNGLINTYKICAF